MRFLIIVVALSFFGCEIRTYPEPPTHYIIQANEPQPIYYDYDYDYQYEYCRGELEPYWEYPDWCDDYCCTWYVGYGCFEEWCYWDHACGWEYETMWCY